MYSDPVWSTVKCSSVWHEYFIWLFISEMVQNWFHFSHLFFWIGSQPQVEGWIVSCFVSPSMQWEQIKLGWAWLMEVHLLPSGSLWRSGIRLKLKTQLTDEVMTVVTFPGRRYFMPKSALSLSQPPRNPILHRIPISELDLRGSNVAKCESRQLQGWVFAGEIGRC